MRAMVMDAPGHGLALRALPRPEPGSGQVLVEVAACAVCRTDLHVVDGELTDPKLPIIPGHEIVGRVAARGEGVEAIGEGDRVGVPWLGWTCGECRYCRSGQENLCPNARFTGYQIDGGYAEYTVADVRYCFPVPGGYGDAEAAPLLCAFTRPGDATAQAFARRLGCEWAGDADALPSEELDAAILFAPVGALVPAALRAIRPGGIVVCGGIHMSDIPSFPYDLLWREKRIVSVANLTRRDGLDFLALAPKVPVRTEIETLPLAEANEALRRLRAGELNGAAVLVPEHAAP